MSEVLDRIQAEIRERLEASRAAVREHERLEAALHALSDAGSRATRAVASRRRSSGAPSAAEHAPAARGEGAASPGAQQPASGAQPAGTVQSRKRAAPGANREAVMRVVSARPGASASEIAAASGVKGSTLYSLLRRLTQEGALEKRELPGAKTGYAVPAPTASAPSTPSPDSEPPAQPGSE